MVKKPENQGWQLLRFLVFFFNFYYHYIASVTSNIFVQWQLQLLED